MGKHSHKKKKNSAQKTQSARELINNPENVVDEMTEALLMANPTIVRIAGTQVVVRRDYEDVKRTRVSLISGGGSGHEPAHAGFVGRGMLTACVAGNVFASPSVDAILTAIRTVTGPRGCLLIVKNYTGDRVNFGLAAEQAKLEGLRVEMIIVGDDVALPDKGISGRRGLAGTLFVHKVAGAAAEKCADLQDVVLEAQEAVQGLGTIGVALTTCTHPGEVPKERIPVKHMEIGLGIHGEPGAHQTKLETANRTMEKLVKALSADGHWDIGVRPGDSIALLINNLGGLPLMQLLICLRHVHHLYSQEGVTVSRVYVGTLMTSLDMVGMSVTVMKLNPMRTARLDSRTFAPGWPNQLDLGVGPLPTTTTIQPAPEPVAEQKEENGMLCDWSQMATVMKAAADALVSHEPKLTELDTLVGDGDCGHTHKRGAEGVLALLEGDYPTQVSAAGILLKVADSVRHSMGGTSGVIYDIIFRAAAGFLRAKDPANDPKLWVAAFECGLERAMFYGGAKPGYRTMLDAWVPALEAATAALEANQGVAAAASAAAEAAHKGCEATKEMGALAGRSSYVPKEKLAQCQDPGALAVDVALAVVAKVLSE